MNINESFSSDYLKASDLKGADVIVTIDRVAIEPVGRTKEIKPVLYFKKATKGLILNKTNAKKIETLLGTSETTAWTNQRICLYPTTTEFQGEMHACTRIKSVKEATTPTPQPRPPPRHPRRRRRQPWPMTTSCRSEYRTMTLAHDDRLAHVGALWGRGFSIIPLLPAEKVPAIPWSTYQSRRPTFEELEQWLGANRESNFGIVTGAVSNVVVVDADNTAALAWVRTHLPATPMRTRTAKGEHWFFRHPGGLIRNRARLRTADATVAIDLRGDAGYVVAPGSTHPSGITYEPLGTWPPVDELPVFDPNWLEPNHGSSPVIAPAHIPAPLVTGPDLFSGDERRDRAAAYLEAMGPAIEGHGGDHHTFRAAAVCIRDFALDDGAALDLLRDWNQQNVPPWTEGELAAKIANARKYGTKPARAARPRVTVDPDVACPTCGLETCEGHDTESPAAVFEDLEDAGLVIAEGRELARTGVVYCIDGVLAAYGTVGYLVGYAKTGKTTFAQHLAAAVAMGRPFLDRATQRTKVLVLAAEDPPAYTAWLARHLEVEPGALFFRRQPLLLTPPELARICGTVAAHHFGLVLIASWQAVTAGLLRDENDNAGTVQLVEQVKRAARQSGIPWLIDAHSGKGEDQSDAADPSRAMRGASAAAGAADFTLSLRYAAGPFSTQRRLTGKGRFVDFPPVTLDYDRDGHYYTVVDGQHQVHPETTWALIEATGALTSAPRSVTEIARACGLVAEEGKPTATHRRHVFQALKGRPVVAIVQEFRHGRKTTLFKRLETS